MINRLRKELNGVGMDNPGMADGGEVSHDDQAQDAEMIRSVLQKICDDMDGLEADRIMPAHKKPGYAHGNVVAPVHPAENHGLDMHEAEPENQSNELDPHILESLMEKAEGTNDEGETPEDELSQLPPTIAEAIRRKKTEMKK